jgi:hypothetical protein
LFVILFSSLADPSPSCLYLLLSASMSAFDPSTVETYKEEPKTSNPSPTPLNPKCIRVLFIHGGGNTDKVDKLSDKCANYLRLHFGGNFYMRAARYTSDFESTIKIHGDGVKVFLPDVIVSRSQGGRRH